MTAYAFNQRFGPDNLSGYSNGTGGIVELSLYVCNPLPTGSPLSTITFHPSNPHTQAETKTPIPWTAQIPPGLVCITARNIDPNTANFMSANELWVPGGDVDSPRQPAFPDDSLAVLSKGEFGSGWSVKANNTPVFDVTLANGQHEGQAFYEREVSPIEIVTAPSDRVRERFTPAAPLTVSAAWFRVQRRSGSTLSVSLAGKTCQTSIAGVPLEKFSVDVYTGAEWVRCPLSVSLPANVEQSVVFATDGSLRVAPIRPALGWASRQFPNGTAEKSIAGGAWQPFYQWDAMHLQMYLEVAQ